MGAIRPLKVTFEIDADGLIYDPYVPPTLDGIIDWALSPMVRKSANAPTRGEEPEEIRLPLGTWHVGSYWGWCASALFPDCESPEESIQYFRKRFRRGYIHLTKGMVNMQSGPTRDYNLPYVKLHPEFMIGYCLGNRKRINDLLRRNVKYLAKKRNRGKGRIVSLKVEVVDNDYSVLCDGKAMRWLPHADGLRNVRLRPPYWNNVNRVPSCEIGDIYNSSIRYP